MFGEAVRSVDENRPGSMPNRNPVVAALRCLPFCLCVPTTGTSITVSMTAYLSRRSSIDTDVHRLEELHILRVEPRFNFAIPPSPQGH